jgi:hypothetical protein
MSDAFAFWSDATLRGPRASLRPVAPCSKGIVGVLDIVAGLKVGRVDAPRVAAARTLVQDQFSSRNRSIVNLPRDTVRQFHLVTPSDAAVPIREGVPGPSPTGRHLLDVLPEALHRRPLLTAEATVNAPPPPQVGWHCRERDLTATADAVYTGALRQPRARLRAETLLDVGSTGKRRLTLSTRPLREGTITGHSEPPSLRGAVPSAAVTARGLYAEIIP